NSLLALIEDILDVSRIEAGRLELEVREVAERAVVEEALAPIAFQATEKCIELVTAIGPDVPAHVRVDGRRLRQIIANLVGNAVKFSDGGDVAVRLSWADDTLRGEVVDSGIGI